MKYVLILLCFGFSACQETENKQAMDITMPPMGAQAITYLALGDSYTIGEGVLAHERWPVQLADALNEKGYEVSPPTIIARTGWTTSDLTTAIEAAQINETYDLVSLLIGVNNQYRGLSIAQFRTELVELIDISIAFAGGDVQKFFMLSIPDWGVTPFAEGRDRDKISDEIDRFNEVIQQETSKRNILLIDITEISRQPDPNAALLSSDKLHPAGKMYRLWVDKALPQLLEKINK